MFHHSRVIRLLRRPKISSEEFGLRNEKRKREFDRVNHFRQQRINLGLERLVLQEIGRIRYKDDECYIVLKNKQETINNSIEERWNPYDALDGLDEYSH